MKKIRINELARELEVKPGVILDLLPDLGVDEKKTHSSSIDEETAVALRDKLAESGELRVREHSNGYHEDASEEDSSTERKHHEHESDRPTTPAASGALSASGAHDERSSVVEAMMEKAAPSEAAQTAAVSSRPGPLPLRPTIPQSSPPGSSTVASPTAQASTTATPPAVMVTPEVPQASERQQTPGATRTEPNRSEPNPPNAAEQAPTVAPSAPEKPAGPKFQPLRPPLGGSGGAIHPPLATPHGPSGFPLPGGSPTRPAGVPVRPGPSTPPVVAQPNTSTEAPTGLAPGGSAPASPAHAAPGTPVPVANPMPASPSPAAPTPAPPPSFQTAPGPSVPAAPIAVSPIPGAPAAPAPSARPAMPATPAARMPGAAMPAPPRPMAPQRPQGGGVPSQPAMRMPIRPNQMGQPGGNQQGAGQQALGGPGPGAPQRPVPPTHIVAPGGPGASATPGPAASAGSVPGSPIPSRPAPPRPGLTPGAPIAPRPQGTRPPLAGQPAARPIVPPRPDLVQRLRQQQNQPRPGQGPGPGQAGPGMGASAMPGAPRPTAPMPRSPSPGQPIFRGPIRPGQPSMRGPGGGAAPGMPSFPGGPRRPGTRPMHPTSLRPESATPMPTEQRRQFGRPAGRPGPRKREEQEGNIRERATKRHVIAEPPPIDREITVAEGITVKELSEKLNVKANSVIRKLLEKKIFASINQTLDVKLAEELAREFGASTNQVSYEQETVQELAQAEDTQNMVRRAPVVTIMGHVDHGKTSLLDSIRETNVAGREAGGITQHIGAYHIEKNGRKIVFIDTPGHQAFTRMRARGAKVTDIVVLVVSADDGVMPQTLEAIDHARAANVPIIVAINKIDKPDAQPDRVKQQLADRGLLAEDWGGDVVMTPVSAKTGQNLDLLLEMILLVADIQDLKANPQRPAVGTVLEAKLDRGRGPVATMLVRNGTFHVGDQFICGALFSKVRAMFDDRGAPVKEVEPSMPVEVIGLDSLPEVGDTFQVVTDASKAKQIVIYREAKARDAAMAKGARVATLASLNQQFKEGDVKDLNVIIKADVGGTAEVLSDTLTQLSNEKVRVRVLRTGVGAITEDDVLLGSASEALIIGFNVKTERNAQATAEQQKVDIRLHSIIYELIEEVQRAMTGMLEPIFKETVQGHAEVRETFRISKVGVVAGCFVSDGTIRRDAQIRVLRDKEVIHTGKIEALKRFKNDASEVKNGLECGISLANFNGVNVGDVIEAYITERIAAELPPPVPAAR